MRNMNAPGRADPELPLSSPLAEAVAQRDQDTLAMVERAIERRQVLLAYQPVIQARDPAAPAFQEGLIRVLDDTGRIIPAGDFFAAAESRELGRKLDTWALRLGIDALERHPTLRLSINMSARSIGYPDWINSLRAGLRRRPEIGERLILEITERTAISMPDLVQVFMQEMQTKGIAFALDDFGAGYTALRFLKDFYFDVLKIDGQFIRGIASDPDNQVITEAILLLGRQFDMITVAENVESAEDANFLVGAGCDLMQGYFFGAPKIRPPWEAEQTRQRA